MSDSSVTVPDIANPGPEIDCEAVTRNGVTYYRQRVNITGGALGAGDLTLDAWGSQKVSFPYSLFHGIWTFDVPASMWFTYENGTQVYTSTNIVSTNGAAVLTTSAAKTALILESRECPRYQPNRGHLYSTAVWCPSKTANGVREWGLQTAENGVFFRLKADGLVYAVLRSGGVETKEEVIDTSGIADFDVQKGNVYDIQYQWRGVGNYKFFINLVLVHTFDNLGKLTALSMQNPALPVSFKATRTTENVAIHVGCVDITSENGSDDTEQPTSAFGDAVAVNGTNVPVLVCYNPLQINGVTNTRTIKMHKIAVICAKKATFRIWRSRTLADITGATFKVIGSGSYVQCDSPDMDATAVSATAATVANMEFLGVIQVEAGIRETEQLSMEPHLDFTLVRGDYLVVTCSALATTADVVIKFGEEV